MTDTGLTPDAPEKNKGLTPEKQMLKDMAVALFDTIQELLPTPHRLVLKWPNDLLIGDAKLSGILLEAERDAVVIGIGVNLVSAPDLADRKSAALTQFGPAPDRDAFAESLATHFATELERWRTYGLEPLIRSWTAAGTPKGTTVSVHEPDGGKVSGKFDGLEADGSMRLRLADGTSRVIHAGDVILAEECARVAVRLHEQRTAVASCESAAGA